MKHLVGIIFSLSMLAAVQASADGITECRDRLYDEAGAEWGQALKVCVQNSSESYVSCVVDRYNDEDTSHTFETAAEVCRTSAKVRQQDQCELDMVRSLGVSSDAARSFCQSGLTQSFAACVIDLRKDLNFTTQRALRLCEWSEEKSIYACATRKFQARETDNDKAVANCYEEYRRGELNSRGVNIGELEEKRRRAFEKVVPRQSVDEVRQRIERNAKESPAEKRAREQAEARAREDQRRRQVEEAARVEREARQREIERQQAIENARREALKPKPTPAPTPKPAPVVTPQPKAPEAAKPVTPKAPEATKPATPKAPQPVPPPGPKCSADQQDCGVIVDLPNL